MAESMRKEQKTEGPTDQALTKLSGWGANAWTACRLTEPESPAQFTRQIEQKGTIARGLGRSYGDASVNEGKRVLGTRKLDRYIAFDESTGTLTCEAGISLARIIQDFLPRGWFPMITPGTKFVTVGGCIANDVHGKAHHAQGCFSSSVDAFTIVLANGEERTASRDENADLFWANFGGMGLLGIILTVTLRLRKVETAYFRQKSIEVRDLEEMMQTLEEQDHVFPYSVATLDVFARGAQLGRGVIAFGDHATRAELSPAEAKEPLRVSGPPRLTLPFNLPQLTLNSLSMRVGNAMILGLQRSAKPIGHYESFFYPLDMIGQWNRAYGRRGFTQYQFVIPFSDGARRMREILGAILSSGELPFLNILKRLGKESGGILSFPKEGYTFAIDFPIRQGTAALLQRIDAMVLEAGGRIYLGKDSFVDKSMFRAMYPALDRWLAIKAKYDPEGVFSSDLARRVGLCA
jgi:decaprenylphospho-beta-D-ribofuranose 2-oxidase